MKHSIDALRSKWLDFFKSKGHAIIPSSSLLPENDPTTLFTGSGMQPMISYLLGEKHPLGTRIADSQKCFRAVDMDEVGDNRHTTFFEMLGNWSFGDYFKKEQITWMWELLVKELGLNPQNLYVTCHKGSAEAGIPRDDTAALVWQSLFGSVGLDAKMSETAAQNGIHPGERIFFYEDKKNWWSRAGVPSNMPVGEPGGPDSEMFWDFDPNETKKIHAQSLWKDQPCHVNCDCGRFLEIGNNVFMAFRKSEDGSFKELVGKNIDFGGGLERIAMALENSSDIFLTGVFDKTRRQLETISQKIYGENPIETQSMRVILDHLRAATFLISDGALPTNTDAGYFVRRLIRRAIRAGRKLGLTHNFCGEISKSVIETYKTAYPDVYLHQEKILLALETEEEKFRKTLERGERAIEKCIDLNEKIDGKKAFWFFETYGFPREMTEEIMLEHLFLASDNFGKIANLEILREAVFSAHPELKFELKQFAEDFEKSAQVHADNSRTAAAGKFKGGLADHGDETTALHSAAHLMLAGLRKILGSQVEQRGSNITAERLRFDFSHPEKLTLAQISAVEDFVNAAIAANATTTMIEMKKEDALASGATGCFWDKYPEKVKVYEFRSIDGTLWSREICGGPHKEQMGALGRFKIQKEEASSAGVRRIKAVLENAKKD